MSSTAFSAPKAASHGALHGGSGSGIRFRPARLSGADLPVGLACRFRFEGVTLGPFPVLDLGSFGIALAAPDDPAVAPGSVLEELELVLPDRVIWSGAATIAHVTPGRVGARFAGFLDVRQLRIDATLEARMSVLREQRATLPADWRAAVSDLRRLLEDARHEVLELERGEHDDPLWRREEQEELLEGLRARWAPAYYAALVQLGEKSAGLQGRSRILARSYADATLMPILRACPFHRRARDKPLGYAGDFRMMELHFGRDGGADGLFGRLLHSVAQGYTLARAVIDRELVMRQAAREVVERPSSSPATILSLAAGPAVELGRLLEEADVRRPTELLLLDQDRHAHENAHRRLTRVLVGHRRGSLPVTVTCLHFSVRQLLRPHSPEDHAVVDGVLAGLDLAYCAGLFDYLSDAVARRLTQFAYARLRPGGRLLFGNLSAAPDCDFMMDYVLDWPLHYRTADRLLRFADDLSPAPAHVGVTRDATGHAIFLDVKRPA
jgi:extracellular factor (EF) 3-hydroxypalmitic acid methyl ester biosynthesis protein